eukprot:1176832-Prorocentrum_minimum.AAC.4
MAAYTTTRGASWYHESVSVDPDEGSDSMPTFVSSSPSNPLTLNETLMVLLAVPQCRPMPRSGLGLVQATRTLHTELAPGNPGCSQRW